MKRDDAHRSQYDVCNAWREAVTADMTRAQVDAVIADEIRRVLNDLTTQLLDDPDLPADVRDAIWQRAAAFARAECERFLIDVWQRLRMADGVDDGIRH
jgi:hypothetical protein